MIKTCFALLSVALLSLSGQAWSAENTNATDNDLPYLFDLYRYLHSHPELSFKETETAARLASEMSSLGFVVTEGVGGTGLVAVLENGDGPTLMIRADMDALPVNEMTGLHYASTVTSVEQTGQEVSVMHACGHDMHMTVWVGTARKLVAMKDQWSGTLVMIGQPAEERGAGARMMLDDGLFKRFLRPDANVAFHVSPTLQTGAIGYTSGFAMANVDSVDIKIRGIGGHGAYPHTTKDPVVLASQIVLALQTLVSREISPLESGVVTVGSFHGGAKHNVISDQVDLQLTVRSYSDETRAHLLAGIERITKGQAEAFGMPKDLMPTVTTKKEFTPSLYNDPDLTARVTDMLKENLGDERIVEVSPVMGGEDFARYGRTDPRIPSLMMRLGSVDPKKIKAAKKNGTPLPSLHSSVYAPVPETTIQTGVEAMTLTALELLNE